ncbi:MAG: hypothetical protein M3071_23075 [Actinomycetota bacterium]|nr:hypothetical protein [Actinomycetota bacterium]
MPAGQRGRLEVRIVLGQLWSHQEIGTASVALTNARTAQRRFLSVFNGA